MTKHSHEQLTQTLKLIRDHCRQADGAIHAGRGYDDLSTDEQGLLANVTAISCLALTTHLLADEILEGKE